MITSGGHPKPGPPTRRPSLHNSVNTSPPSPGDQGRQRHRGAPAAGGRRRSAFSLVALDRMTVRCAGSCCDGVDVIVSPTDPAIRSSADRSAARPTPLAGSPPAPARTPARADGRPQRGSTAAPAPPWSDHAPARSVPPRPDPAQQPLPPHRAPPARLSAAWCSARRCCRTPRCHSPLRVLGEPDRGPVRAAAHVHDGRVRPPQPSGAGAPAAGLPALAQHPRPPSRRPRRATPRTRPHPQRTPPTLGPTPRGMTR